jgi:hypothetical protein
VFCQLLDTSGPSDPVLRAGLLIILSIMYTWHLLLWCCQDSMAIWQLGYQNSEEF